MLPTCRAYILVAIWQGHGEHSCKILVKTWPRAVTELRLLMLIFVWMCVLSYDVAVENLSSQSHVQQPVWWIYSHLVPSDQLKQVFIRLSLSHFTDDDYVYTELNSCCRIVITGEIYIPWLSALYGWSVWGINFRRASGRITINSSLLA